VTAPRYVPSSFLSREDEAKERRRLKICLWCDEPADRPSPYCRRHTAEARGEEPTPAGGLLWWD
jgi:hypothetical protein